MIQYSGNSILIILKMYITVDVMATIHLTEKSIEFFYYYGSSCYVHYVIVLDSCVSQRVHSDANLRVCTQKRNGVYSRGVQL